MVTQKRRIVYLSDEDWGRIKKRADRVGVTVSAFIRGELGYGERPWRVSIGVHVPTGLAAAKEWSDFRPVPKPSQRK